MGLQLFLNIFKDFFLFKVGMLSKEELAIRVKDFSLKTGPVVIKYIQLLLLNKYLNKEKNMDYIKHLHDLEDNVYSPKLCESITTLGKKFTIKNGSSLSCGSIAYVYEVYIDNDEKNTYILKRTHENIKQSVNDSYALLKSTISYFPEKYNLLDCGNDLLDFMIIQTNLNVEKEMLNNFCEIFSDVPRVHIPKVINNDENNLLMTKENGMHIDKFIKEFPHHSIEVIYLLFGCIHKMISSNVIHGDFHKGNFLLFEKNGKVNITILDLGLVFTLTDEQKEYFLNYLEMNSEEDFVKLLNTFTKNDISVNIPVTKLKKRYGNKNDLFNVKSLCEEYDIKLPLEILHFISAISLLNLVSENIKDKKYELRENAMDFMLNNYFI